MHELSIAQALVEQIERIARRESSSRVESVTLSVGDLCGVDPRALEMAFPLAAEQTIAEGADLKIHTASATVQCRGCGEGGRADPLLLCCGRCGSTDVEINGGRELLITSLELNVPEAVD
jgi:hydrogenase nickel incorporation protein HypA/HybF